jgi:hypothetical protein
VNLFPGYLERAGFMGAAGTVVQAPYIEGTMPVFMGCCYHLEIIFLGSFAQFM